MMDEIGFPWNIFKHAGFNSYYEQLVLFKEEYNHVNVPSNYESDKQLARWVGRLRQMRKCIREKGFEYAPENEGDNSDDDSDSDDSDGGRNNNKGSNDMYRRGKTYLTKERVDLLDSVGFEW